jgi:hypothetical protein
MAAKKPKTGKPKSRRKLNPEEEKEKAMRESRAFGNLRTMARPGNRVQFFRLLAMQTPVKPSVKKEADK